MSRAVVDEALDVFAVFEACFDEGVTEAVDPEDVGFFLAPAALGGAHVEPDAFSACPAGVFFDGAEEVFAVPPEGGRNAESAAEDEGVFAE